ncbi:bifunctional acetate--CoA ligase family protein/GNAT family N-acetyltransferase [Janthinobacterium agaricidamnosum]|uniref:Acetyltransferase family protein n=1 Tax=Janthinobacterium agaricidamnosum NBRC 102515 = DSM 9628 TaxID=1349767 RepID=W0V062_9BURK|nr:bifunctional acetate--CoA ligase family protein/GNAT family N-acetyltransferase [Janthinobacterium agaricidamnosum]CDG82219.1 acetyltransferase family protein [Janthinobacterium agaricidamnosum NBRC 102515 = DSM 9628]
MSIRNFDSLFKPKSVAVIGASSRPGGIGATVFNNMLAGGFDGPVWPVNPKYQHIHGQRCYAKVSALPGVPELAVICTPPATLPGLIRELGGRGTRAAIVMTAGFDDAAAQHGASGGRRLRQAMLKAAQPHLLRILGPDSVGLLVPGIGLNASVAHIPALPGQIALVSQSVALASGVLDWAVTRGLGFSKFISLGGGADIDFGDLLDYLAGDADSAAILLYLENLHAARKFMSAARVAARSKPVIVLKAGHAANGAADTAWHAGALAGSDAVYDAAIRRSGMLRVYSADELFDAVETLAHVREQRGERLTILGNGGGMAVMASDALAGAGGQLASLSPASVAVLDKVLPPGWSRRNPVGIAGAAPVQRYVDSVKPLLNQAGSDALLFLHAPTALVSSKDIADALAPLMRASARTVLACWLGGASVAPARQVFTRAGIPTYDTPEKAVHGFMQIVQYRRNQELLMEVPGQLPQSAPRRARVRDIVAQALAAGQTVLGECRAKEILAAYGIPVAVTRMAADVEEALAVAAQIGYPVALKIHSADLAHKSDVGGVALDLDTPDILRTAAAAMLKRVRRMRPDARLDGFTVQQMARRPHAHELIVGVTTDPVFGPVILVGQGGLAVEVTADHAIGLPPLNTVLARDMISRTRVSKLLAGYRSSPPADIDAVCRTLIQVAQLVADVGELAELDINPLLVDPGGVIALDARIRLQPGNANDRLAIRPYPQELEQQVEWQGQQITLRPIRPEDAPQHMELFRALDPEDIRARFFTTMRELSPSQLARLTHIDYDRAMAFIATRANALGQPETLGVVRAVADPDNISAEFAIAVRSRLKGQGLGPILFAKLIAYFRSRGTQQLTGETLSQNKGMQRLVKRAGGAVFPSEDSGTLSLRIQLQGEPA